MAEITPEVLFFDTPLYQYVKLQENSSIYNFFGSGVRINYYSISLKENTTYTVSYSAGITLSSFIEKGGFIRITLTCVRTSESLYFEFYFSPKQNTLFKYGQLPSIADLHISKIKEFDKVLSKEKLKEFTRAIGLAANGVGIGSFVYLRRIFEDLIEEAYQIAKLETQWNNDTYVKARMSEKIGLLKNQLPVFLVENKELYSILSLGIHSLTENDCLAYFETVKLGIELILEEKGEKLAKQKRLEDAKSKIAQLKSTIAK